MKLTSQTARSTGFAEIVRTSRSRALTPSCNDHARIGAQLPVELAGAHIDRMHARRSGLQQAIGEAAGRRADIRADRARDIDVRNPVSAPSSLRPPRLT